MLYLILTTLILGLVVGSFINSFLWRYQTKTTYAGRSICPICKHKLSWYDNIPLLSLVILSARCRYCKNSISVQYPIVELITSITFAIIAANSRLSKILPINVASGQYPVGFWNYVATLLFALIASGILIAISVYDYKTQEIPNNFSLALVLTSAFYLLAYSIGPQGINWLIVAQNIVSAVVAFIFFYAFVFFSKETWMGGGDAKLALGIGLILGPAGTALAIMIASITGSLYGITAIIIKKLMTPKNKINSEDRTIPFGPFLSFGTIFVLCYGQQIIDWYVKMLSAI